MEEELSHGAPKSWRQFKHWQSLSDGFLVCLVIVGPTSLFSELWRGKPVIDRGPSLWLFPAAVMALGFFIGGIIAGRHRRSPKGALTQGFLVAALVIALIFLADLIRRLVLGEGLGWGVFGYWVAALAAALLVAGLGGLVGRSRTKRAIKQSQMNRFF
jgi:hypothetical protein